jgi:hypothetical protein
VDEAVLAGWHALFGPDAYYVDDEISVYALPTAATRVRVASFNSELGIIGLHTRRVWLPDGQFLAVRITWEAMGDLYRDLACRLSLSAAGGSPTTTEAELIAPTYPTRQWPSGVAVDDEYLIPITPSVHAGKAVLTVTVVEAASGAEQGSQDIPITVEAEARPFVPALEEMEHRAGITFGEEMRLLGYTPRQQGGRLTLDMYWQAVRTMEADYKVFVHLIDPANSAIVVQVDTMPRNWSYPTSRWGRREVFVDRIELDLAGVAGVTYRLVLGVYEEGGDRLPARGMGGVLAPEGRAVLDERLAVRDW